MQTCKCRELDSHWFDLLFMNYSPQISVSMGHNCNGPYGWLPEPNGSQPAGINSPSKIETYLIYLYQFCLCYWKASDSGIACQFFHFLWQSYETPQWCSESQACWNLNPLSYSKVTSIDFLPLTCFCCNTSRFCYSGNGRYANFQSEL